MTGDAPSPSAVPFAPSCAEVEALLAAYALGALEPGERRAVVTHLAACPVCHAALTRHERAIDALGLGVAPVVPPASLGRRLLAEIGHDGAPATPPYVPPIGIVPIRPADDGKRWRWATAGLGVTAAGLAVVAALLLVGLVVALMLLRQAQEAGDAAVGDRRELAEYLSDGGTITPLVPAGGAIPASGRGSLIVAPHQPGAALVVTGLAVGDGRRYRVWVERDGQRTWLDDLETEPDGIGYAILTTPASLSTYDTVGFALKTPGQAPRDLLLTPIQPGTGP